MKCLILYLCLGILGCITLSGMAYVFSRSMVAAHHPPQLAVVDMQALIARQSRHLAKTSSRKISARQIQEAGNRLKEILGAFADKHNLILLNKGALMGGTLPDHTETVLAFLEQEEINNEGQ